MSLNRLLLWFHCYCYFEEYPNDAGFVLLTPLFAFSWFNWHLMFDVCAYECGWGFSLWPTFPQDGGLLYRWNWKRRLCVTEELLRFTRKTCQELEVLCAGRG